MKFLGKNITNASELQRLIGLNFEQLDLLVQKIEPLWKESERERLSHENRKREVGGGRPYKLTVKEIVIVILVYYKQYITQEFLGFMAGIKQSNVSRLLKKMLPLIEEAADPLLKTYLNDAKKDFSKKISTLEELWARHPDLRDISTDANEQQVFRSQDYQTQEKYYSGKSKQHTIKTQISVAQKGRILDISKSYPGSVHDKKMMDEERTVEKFDKRVPLRFDSGYQGVKTDYPDHYIILPTKKPKGQELSSLAKEHNTVNSKRRVVAEHALARMQKFRMLAVTFRQSLNIHNQAFRNVAAILNFKLENPALAM